MACFLSRFLPSRIAPHRTFTVLGTRPDTTNESSHFNERCDRVLQNIAQQISPDFVPSGRPGRFLRVDCISSPDFRRTYEQFFNLFEPLQGLEDYRLTTYMDRTTREILQIAQVEFDSQANATRAAGSLHTFQLNGSPLRLAYLPSDSSCNQDLEVENPNLEIVPQPSVLTVMAEDAIRPPARKKPKLSIPVKTICKICTVEITGSHSKPCLRCKQPWCLDCVKTWFIHATQDFERMPARCCYTVMHHGVAGGTLSAAELDLYKLRYDEHTTSNPLYCPVPTCSTFIPPRLIDSSQDTVNCTICTARICTKCKQLAAADHVCEEETAAIKIKAFNYKTCPKCGTGVMKMFGCPHVRCQCGAHFCWDCLRAINICYRSPCQAAIEDGQYGDEEDEAVSDSEDEAEDTGIVAELNTDNQEGQPTTTATSHIDSITAPHMLRGLLNVFRGRRQRRSEFEERRNEVASAVQLHPPEPRRQVASGDHTAPTLASEDREASTFLPLTVEIPADMASTEQTAQVARQAESSAISAILPGHIPVPDATTSVSNIPTSTDEHEHDESEDCSCMYEQCHGGSNRICMQEVGNTTLPDPISGRLPEPQALQINNPVVAAADSVSSSIQQLPSSLATDSLTAELPFAQSSNTNLDESDFWTRENPAVFPTNSTPAIEPSTPNLDDPDLLDWEAEDYDFGEEPAEEAFDVWGCACNFTKLKKEAVDEHWMQDLKYLDCMKCFGEVVLQTTPQLFPGLSGVKNAKDKLAWHCAKCGIVVCGKCERAKKKEVKGLMKANGREQN